MSRRRDRDNAGSNRGEAKETGVARRTWGARVWLPCWCWFVVVWPGRLYVFMGARRFFVFACAWAGAGSGGWCVRENVRGAVMQRVASAAKKQGQHPLSVKGQREGENVDAKGKESKGPTCLAF